jgi:hypothetical protein
MKKILVGLLALGSLASFASVNLEGCSIYINPNYTIDRQFVIDELEKKGFDYVDSEDEANFEFESVKMHMKVITAGVYARALDMPEEYNLFNRSISPHAVEGYVFSARRAFKRAYKYVLENLEFCDESLLIRLGF